MLDSIVINDITEQIQSFKSVLIINEHSLNTECAKQPQLVLEAGELRAKVIKLYDKLKNKIKVTAAEVETLIRSNPSDFGLTKVTDSTVKTAAIIHPTCKELNIDFIDVTELHNIVSSLYDAICGRRAGTRALIDLFTNEYYSAVDVPTSELAHECKRGSIAALRAKKGNHNEV